MVRYKSIPGDLRALRAWLLWKTEPNPHKPGKFLKVPYCTDGRRRSGPNGSPGDRRRLADFKTVMVASRRYSGIGLALLPELPVWVLDLDGCIEVMDSMDPTELAKRVIASGTYVEQSPSGTGLHAIFAGKIGVDAKNHDEGVESFDSRGWVTVTGDRLNDKGRIAECPEDLIAEIRAIVGEGSHRRVECTTAPAENPDLIEAIDLPLSLARRLVDPYPPGCDRSAVAFALACRLRGLKFTREEVMEFCSIPEMLAPALERRLGDIASAREWMWRYVVEPAFGKEPRR
ncbi:MAG TPA: hypothetical protein VFX20_15855 [Steroidobacteraceae bacterium]|nr:hypothetical protein [Steroidobacteraceae bacterium]